MSLEADAAALLGAYYSGLAYEPGPTCGAFIRSDGRRDLLRAPNQVGKSLAGARRADRYSRTHPGSVLGVLVPDLANHYAELSAKIRSVITMPDVDPATTYAEGRGWYVAGRHGIRFRNGARWLFRTGSGPLQGLEGFSADAGWCDEVPERSHWGAFTRGVHGPLWVTMTPIGRDPRWFRARVETDPDTGAPPLEAWQQFVPELSVRECPWLTPGDIAARIAKTDPYEAPQRLRGEWEGPSPDRRLTAMAGANVIDTVPPGDWRVTVSADHGEGAGHEHVVLMLHDDSRIVIAEEYRNPTPTDPTDDARGIAAMLHRARVPWQRVDAWWGDVNSAGKMRPGHSVNEELRRALAVQFGVRPEALPYWRTPSKGAGSVEHGARLLNIALAQGELLCLRRCAATLRSLWSYSGPDDDEGSHAVDAVRYGAVPILTDRRRPSATRLYIGME